MADETQWEAIPVEWAPGPVKALERHVQTAKECLKEVKEAEDLTKMEISKVCENLAVKLKECGGKQLEGARLVEQVRKSLQDLQSIEGRTVELKLAGNCHSIGELRERLINMRAEKEKKMAALSIQRQAISDLHRLVSHHTDQINRLSDQVMQQEMDLSIKSRGKSKNGFGIDAIGELCKWYRGMVELIEGMTGVHCEVVQPNYLHITVTNPVTASSVPIHIHTDTYGRLTSAHVF